MTLVDLKINQSAKVLGINSDNELKQRLLDLGLINGTIITPVFSSPLSDPVAYEFRGNIISIRKKDACNLIVVKT